MKEKPRPAKAATVAGSSKDYPLTPSHRTPLPVSGGGGDPGDSSGSSSSSSSEEDGFSDIGGEDTPSEDDRGRAPRRPGGGSPGGDGGDGGRGRTRRAATPPSPAVRVREAESIKVAAFPEPPAFRNWKSALRQEVAAASGRPDDAFKWFQATEKRSFERLADTGKFPTLDTNQARCGAPESCPW
jgi:hypothetical protein